MSWPIPQCSSKNAEGSGHTEKAYWLPAEVRSSAVCDPRTIWVQLSFTEKDLIKKWESMQQSQGSKRKEKNTSDIFQTVIVGRSGVRDIKYWPKKLGNLKEKRESEIQTQKQYQPIRSAASICIRWQRLGRWLIRIMSLPLSLLLDIYNVH